MAQGVEMPCFLLSNFLKYMLYVLYVKGKSHYLPESCFLSNFLVISASFSSVSI